MNYLDSNIFISPLTYPNSKGTACKNILSVILHGKTKACTSFLTWDEIVFITRKFLGKEISSTEGEKFLKFPNLYFLKVDEEVILMAQQLIMKYDLKPRDAIHAASAIASGCNEIISDDSDFDKIKEIKRLSPEKFKL